MENQTDPIAQPIYTEENKPKRKYLIISLVLLFIVIITVIAVLFLRQNRFQDQNNTNLNPPQAPTPTTQQNTNNDIALTFFRNGVIFTTDFNGLATEVFDTNKEDAYLPKDVQMKLSPNKNYLAYVGLVNDSDLALKIIDITKKNKISQFTFGDVDITDFDWSPDSQNLAVATNSEIGMKTYSSTIYMVAIDDQNSSTPLFEPENIQISNVAWPESKSIYYARTSYTEPQNLAIVRHDTEVKSRSLKIIPSVNEVYNDISEFSINFLISSDIKQMLAFAQMKEESMKSRGQSYELQTLSLPSLEETQPLLNYVLPESSVWYGNYIIGIEKPLESPDSIVVLVNIPQNAESLNLLDMGPSGSFQAVKIIEQNSVPILLISSEFDGQNKITAYNLNDLIEKRASSLISEPLWELDGSFY